MSIISIYIGFWKNIKSPISFVSRNEAFYLFICSRFLWHKLIAWEGQNFETLHIIESKHKYKNFVFKKVWTIEKNLHSINVEIILIVFAMQINMFLFILIY